MRRALTTRPRVVLAGVFLVTAGLASQAARVAPVYDLEAFFPQGTPDRIAYDRMLEIFGRDDRWGMLLVHRAEGLAAGDFRALRASADRLRADAVVQTVHLPNTVRLVVADGARLTLEEALPPDFDDERLKFARRTWATPPYRKTFLSLDGRWARIGVVLRPEHVTVSGRARFDRVLRAEADHLRREGFTVRVGGYPVQRHVLTETIIRESTTLLPWLAAALVVVLALAFRSVRGVILPLAVVGVACIWTTGVMVLLDLPPNLFSSALYVIITVIGIADSVHLLARYRELAPAPDAAGVALTELAWPCLCTSVTTAGGFATLALAGIPMLAHFGIQVALGVGIAMVVTFALIPPSLVLLPAPRGRAPRRSHHLIDRLNRLTARHPRRMVAATIIPALGLATGIFRLEANAPLLADLNPEHPIQVTNRIIEERMAGLINLEILVEPPADDDGVGRYDTRRVHQVAALTERLRAMPEIVSATSVTDVLTHVAQALDNGRPAQSSSLLPATLLLAGNELSAWINESAGVMRVRATMHNVDTAVAIDVFDRIGAAYQELLGEAIAGRLTGQGYVVQRINAQIVETMQASFWLAIAIVLLLVALLVRDARLVAASVLPNVLPILTVAGVMGYVGIDLRYTSALVLTIVFGVVVDDTIHFVSQVDRRGARPRISRLSPRRTGDPVHVARAPGRFFGIVCSARSFRIGCSGSF